MDSLFSLVMHGEVKKAGRFLLRDKAIMKPVSDPGKDRFAALCGMALSSFGHRSGPIEALYEFL